MNPRLNMFLTCSLWRTFYPLYTRTSMCDGDASVPVILLGVGIHDEQGYLTRIGSDFGHYIRMCLVCDVLVVHFNNLVTFPQTGSLGRRTVVHGTNVLTGFTFLCVQIEAITGEGLPFTNNAQAWRRTIYR